jgi:hypothetical protein
MAKVVVEIEVGEDWEPNPDDAPTNTDLEKCQTWVARYLDAGGEQAVGMTTKKIRIVEVDIEDHRKVHLEWPKGK